MINGAIARLGNDLTLLREKQSAEISFKAKARWFEHGEKSNKSVNHFFTFFKQNLLICPLSK